MPTISEACSAKSNGRKMRILHICQRDDPDTGGSLRVAESLVREQRREGIDAWLLFLYGEPAEVSRSLSPKVVCLGLESSREALRGVRLLYKTIRRIAPDIIHSHDGILWPRLAFIFSSVPVVMHSHLPVADSVNSKNKLGQVLVKATTKSLIGISLHTIETWVRDGYPPSQIHYVPNGVDYARFSISDKGTKTTLRKQLGLPADKHILLWVGRLHRSVKGTDRVERVANLLRSNMVLVVVGNGTEYTGMKERCKSLIDEGRMVMVGSTSVPESYYQSADSFLFTSHREAFGLVILEAAFCGLPILAFPVSDGGGAVSLLKEFDVTMVADSDSSDSITEVLSNWIEGDESCRSNREKAIAEYSLSAVSKKVVEVYDLCLNKVL